MTDPTHHLGKFVWHELLTTDVDRAKAFYAELLNWRFETVDMQGHKYTMLYAGERPQGGLLPLTDADLPPHWMAYVSVEDVDAAAAATKKAGGKVCVEPTSMPVGKFAVLEDPAGAYITAWRSNDGDGPDGQTPAVGEFCWDQLNVTEPDRVASFYGEVFGWTRGPFAEGDDTMSVFKRANDAPTASLLQAPAGTPAHWLTYVVVPDLARARDRAVRLGGKVLLEDLPVGDFGTIAVITDPDGAAIGLFEGRSESA